MTEEFQAEVARKVVHTGDLLSPDQLGCGVISPHGRLGHSALLVMHVAGRYAADGPTTTVNVALDPERAAGLIAQIRDTLYTAGVAVEDVALMVEEASRRLTNLRASRETPSFTCPRCGATSYNVHDVEFKYCGVCHVFTEDGTVGP